MSQSRVVNYIKDLSPKQRDRFRQFVFSPYFNQHEKTKELLTIVLKQVNKKNGKGLDRHSLFKLVFPGVAYDEQKLFNVMSYLKRLYQKFIAYQQLENDDLQEQLFTLEGAFENAQSSLFNNRAKVLEKRLEKGQSEDVDFYYTRYRLNRLKVRGFQEGEDISRHQQDILQGMLDDFDKYYIAEKLRICCDLKNLTMGHNLNFNFSFLEELLEYVTDNWEEFQNNPIVKLYYTIFMTQTKGDDIYFNHLKEIIQNEFDLLNYQGQKDLYEAAYNYCIIRINQGNNDYRTDLFDLYKRGLETKMLFTNGSLSEWQYKNITTLGCVLNEFDWTEKFINEYQIYLPEDKRENAFSYNKANFHYWKQDYGNVQSVLINVQFTDFKYHLNATTLLLRTYYKTGDTEALLSLIETFRIFIIRNKEMPPQQKRGYTNFLRFKKRLVNLKHNKHTFSVKNYKEKIDNLRKAIAKTDYVYNIDWLLKECDL